MALRELIAQLRQRERDNLARYLVDPDVGRQIAGAAQLAEHVRARKHDQSLR